MKKEKRNNEIDDPIRDFDTVDLKDLLNRETSSNMATSGQGMTEKNKQSFAYIGSMGNQSITQESGEIPKRFKKVQMIQPLHNDNELNPTVDNGNNKIVEDRSTFFKNE